ncbi:MAG TPA: DUF4162 domain-containing protein, partial [Kofleriaceae bacterium]|nr:DUF4162 domain-containing protein [Kofleriaceae bacterium]
QQKVQFIGTLLHDPELLLLDEPFSGLDPVNTQVMKDVVVDFARSGGTVLFSTHIMEQAEKMCDQVCIIARGKKVLEGPLERIKRGAAGDRLVAVAFLEPEDEARARAGVLADAALVAAVRERRGFLEVELPLGQESGQLLSALVAAGSRLRRFELIEPSLHQIFVDRVGAEAAADKASREEAG